MSLKGESRLGLSFEDSVSMELLLAVGHSCPGLHMEENLAIGAFKHFNSSTELKLLFT